MVQAAAASGLDYAAADSRSRKWWLKVRWILDRIEDLNTEKVWRMQHAQHVSVLDYELQKPAFDGHWESANEILRNIYRLNFPWAKEEGKQKRQREIDELMEQWKARFGDPSDPKVQAHFKKVADALRRKTAKATENMFKDQKKLRQMVNQVVSSRRAKRNKPEGKK